MFALFKVKNWSNCLFWGVFIFEHLILPAERRGFLKNKQKQKNTIFKVKNWSNFLRNILGPVFNFNLDEFLTFRILSFLFFVGGFKGQVRWPKGPPHLALNPPFFVFFVFLFLLLVCWEGLRVR